MRALPRPSTPARACHIEDSNGNCLKLGHRGVCAAPAHGVASAFIQHADQNELCRHNPPMGVQPLCEGRDQTASPAEGLEMLRTLRDPARCRYRSCAVVGAGGTLLGARLGAEIDRCEAVIRVNLTPDGPMAAEAKAAPHHHLPTWIADLGARTTWRVLTMEVYGYLSHYSRFWLKPPQGHGRHPNMSGIPQEPLLAVSCHTPTRSMGRCRAERIRQTFGHPYSASYLINPLLLRQTQRRFFRDAINQHVPSTGMTAIAIAEQMCDVIHLYGFANGSCLDAVRTLDQFPDCPSSVSSHTQGPSRPWQCYHFHECGPLATKAVNQSNFYSNAKASGGFHNFSVQALPPGPVSVCQRLASEGTSLAQLPAAAGARLTRACARGRRHATLGACARMPDRGPGLALSELQSAIRRLSATGAHSPRLRQEPGRRAAAIRQPRQLRASTSAPARQAR